MISAIRTQNNYFSAMVVSAQPPQDEDNFILNALSTIATLVPVTALTFAMAKLFVAEKDYEDLFDRMRKQYVDLLGRSNANALKRVEELLQANPHDIDLLLYKAKLLRKLGRGEGVLAVLNRVAPKFDRMDDPQKVVYLSSRAYSAVLQKDYPAAMDLALRALAIDPMNVPGINSLSRALFGMNRHAEANKLLEESLDAGWDRKSALLNTLLLNYQKHERRHEIIERTEDILAAPDATKLRALGFRIWALARNRQDTTATGRAIIETTQRSILKDYYIDMLRSMFYALDALPWYKGYRFKLNSAVEDRVRTGMPAFKNNVLEILERCFLTHPLLLEGYYRLNENKYQTALEAFEILVRSPAASHDRRLRASAYLGKAAVYEKKQNPGQTVHFYGLAREVYLKLNDHKEATRVSAIIDRIAGDASEPPHPERPEPSFKALAEHARETGGRIRETEKRIEKGREKRGK